MQRRVGRSRSSRAPPGGHGPRPPCLQRPHRPRGAQHADRDRPTWACWGAEGTGPEAGPAAVVTPPWTSRRHGGAPETHAVARWATAAGRLRHRHPCRHRTHTLRRKQGPSTHLTRACSHVSRCGDHDPMRVPARMIALPDVVCQAVNTHGCSGGWHHGPPTRAGAPARERWRAAGQSAAAAVDAMPRAREG